MRGRVHLYVIYIFTTIPVSAEFCFRQAAKTIPPPPTHTHTLSFSLSHLHTHNIAFYICHITYNVRLNEIQPRVQNEKNHLFCLHNTKNTAEKHVDCSFFFFFFFKFVACAIPADNSHGRQIASYQAKWLDSLYPL